MAVERSTFIFEGVCHRCEKAYGCELPLPRPTFANTRTIFPRAKLGCECTHTSPNGKLPMILKYNENSSGDVVAHACIYLLIFPIETTIQTSRREEHGV